MFNPDRQKFNAIIIRYSHEVQIFALIDMLLKRQVDKM